MVLTEERTFSGALNRPTGWAIVADKYIRIENITTPVVKVTRGYEYGSNSGGGRRLIVPQEAADILGCKSGEFSLALCGGNPPMDYAENPSAQEILSAAIESKKVLVHFLH